LAPVTDLANWMTLPVVDRATPAALPQTPT